jgi:putative FmdB family regulatory protein
MPIYEFECSQCQESFEAEQSIEEHARDVIPCRRCGSRDHVRRKVSLFHVQAPKKSA